MGNAFRPDLLRLEPQGPRYPAAVIAAYGHKAPCLHLLGNLSLLHAPGVGFCGSRHASDKGLETAADCADQAARAGLTVVSGYAAGVDMAAHHAALRAQGSTIFVLPEGMDHFRIKKELRDDWDWDRVLVISQFEPGAIWQAYRAMIRNDLIVALSRAMIVIEAGATGGTLNAGLGTLKADKPLFVAVYDHMDEAAAGNADLLGRGGRPLAKSRTPGRANLDRVRAAVAGLETDIRIEQPAFL